MPTSRTVSASHCSPARAARVLSLCSGYGGLDLGLLAVVPGHVVAHAETDPHATAVLARQWPGVPNLGDITRADWSEGGPVDWITAGYPCQPFSAAGKRQGANDSRDLQPSWHYRLGTVLVRYLALEQLIRPAPRPTEPGLRGRERLSPTFVEWMMGLPAGWVTGVEGIPRNAQLRALGNGVVPQQAAFAVGLLLDERLWSPGEAA